MEAHCHFNRDPEINLHLLSLWEGEGEFNFGGSSLSTSNRDPEINLHLQSMWKEMANSTSIKYMPGSTQTEHNGHRSVGNQFVLALQGRSSCTRTDRVR